MRVLAPATEDDMVLTSCGPRLIRLASPVRCYLRSESRASIVRSSIGRIGPTPRKMRPAGSPPRSSPMSATSIGTTDSRSRAGPGDPGTRSRACAPTGTQRAATTAGSLWPPPAVPSPGARDSRTAARAGSGAAGRPRQIDRPPPRSSTSARRATRAARHVAANRGVGAVRVLREIP
jgi:hypothetical protein